MCTRERVIDPLEKAQLYKHPPNSISLSIEILGLHLTNTSLHVYGISNAKMRLDYIPDDPQMPTKEDQEIVTRIKERRGGQLLELDKALLHAPPIANGWNSLLKAIRTENSLPESVREVIICRVAALNQAWYEWDAHAPILDKTGVLSKDAIENLKDRTRAGEGLDEKHLAVLEVTDASTLHVIVPQAKFDKLKQWFSDREIVEITATIAAYNCVSRFLVTLDVGEMAEKFKVDMS